MRAGLILLVLLFGCGEKKKPIRPHPYIDVVMDTDLNYVKRYFVKNNDELRSFPCGHVSHKRKITMPLLYNLFPDMP